MTAEHLEVLAYIKNFSIRLLIDFISMVILVRFVYLPLYKSRELFFTFFVFNIVIFLICFLLNKVKLGIGAAFGLFAVFSMLRYRTEGISTKDMTYIFLTISMGLISAVTTVLSEISYYNYLFLLIINLMLIVITYLFESKILMKKEITKIINYEKFELLHASKSAELLEDVKQRTGINVHKISIQNFDFLRDSAQIKIYYYE